MNKWNYKWWWLGIFSIYSFLVFIWGDTGITAMKNQLQRQAQLRESIGILLSINKGLNRELASYRTDTETIAIQARDLGYINENEKILFIKDLPQTPNIKKPGDVIIPKNETHSIEFLFQYAAIISSIIILFLSGFRWFRMKSLIPKDSA